MSQDKIFSESDNQTSSFGTGFIVGAIFAALAIFFFATKSGRELAKKINFADFDLTKLEQFFANEESQTQTHENLQTKNGENSQHQFEDNGNSTYTQVNHKPTVLGRRFFKRHT